MRALSLIAGLLLAAPAARAAACSVSSTGVAFGAYDFSAAAPLDSAGTITWSCDAAEAPTVALSAGSSANFSPRHLQSGIRIADYNLYLDASCTQIWGDGTQGTSSASGSGTSGQLPVYGRVPAGQALGIGSYADVIQLTITF